MDLVEMAFERYVERIAPPKTQVLAARRSHNAVRDFLRRDDYFGPMITDDFLNGSYARHTAVRPIKDVDVVMVVGQDWLQDAPGEATEALRRKLAQRYPGRRTRRRGRAVRVELYDMFIDVLLAVAPGGPASPLRIPDRNRDHWIDTHPREQLKLVSTLRRMTDGNYCRLVRLLKAWSNTHLADADWPGSFTIECAAYYVISGAPAMFLGRLDTTFTSLLRGVREWDFGRGFFQSRPVVPDPALPHINVAERWTAHSASRYREHVDRALGRIAALDRSRSEEGIVDKWQTIYRHTFPRSTSIRRQMR